jgi:YHS domain-containing protein
MKHFLLFVFALLGLAHVASAQSLINVNKSGLAIKGYDPVAYFTSNAAVKGDPKFTATYEGATYQFSSEENKNLFEANPGKYAPQFGGFCAWAVSQGYTASIDPNAFQIVDGRLLLQYSLGVRKDFSKDTSGNLKKADANWPGIVAKKGR